MEQQQTLTEAQALVQSVQQAARAASEAALALREVGLSRQGGFSEASRTVQCPKEFGSAVSAEDQSGWTDFAFSFRQWLCFADPAYASDLDYVEKNSEIPVTFKDSAEGLASQNRSKKLFAILSGILRNRPLRLLRQVQESNGLEVWRQLHSLFVPQTKVRSMAILGTIMSFPSFTKDRTLLEQMQILERLGDEYQRASGVNISEEILQTVLVRSLPKAVQQHIQLGMTNTTSYQEIRDRVVAYEKVSSSWTKDRILIECGGGPIGAVTSYASASDSGPTPMEINMVQKGKGKKGKGPVKGKGKDGSHGAKSKGKGKSYESGKGKGFGKNQSKGQFKGQNNMHVKPKLDSNTCAYCGKPGHWQKDCHKKKLDQQQQVRIVGESHEPKPETTYSSNSVSTGSGSQAIRLVTMHGQGFHDSHVEDLTVHSMPTSPCTSPHSVRMLSECQRYDMSATDSDECWTLSPSCKQHVRAVSNMEQCAFFSDECDVILDSGADTSALPLQYASVGIEGPAPSTCYVDAQGTPLDVQSTRVANVQFGDVTFRERFIVSDITCPLLSLGNVLKSGWSIVHHEGQPWLMKGDKKVAVSFRNNSLCARGQISVVTEVDNVVSRPAVRAIQLGIVLRSLVPGWNRINPHLFAIKTVRPRHVDTTMCPADELMWHRTTLVYREEIGWELDEYCERISDIQHSLEDEFYNPESVVEVITIAHKHAMQDEYLGFFMEERPSANPGNVNEGDAMSDGYSASIGEDQRPEEPPVDEREGEPLPEDRVVEFTDDEQTVTVDGVVMNLQCTLKVLRAGCNSLGISGRGGKAKCLQRMVDHVRAQALIAAHGAEVRLRGELERQPVAQSKPEEPSQAEVENHALTHEPFKPWCSLCTQYRARQDQHSASHHESVGHSVVSFDFGYCSRMDGEVDKQTCLFVHDRATKMMAAIPTPQKGGKHLQYLTTEVTRFIVHTQHREIAIRTDREPSILALTDAVKRTCRNLDIVVHDEGAPVGDHQSNGAAEITVQILRAKAGLLVQQIEDRLAGGKVIFGCNHPVFCWALIHAGWLHNHFSVAAGQTAYERCSDRVYSGKLAMFGEDVLGYLRTDLKAAPRWQHGIWMGKTVSGDLHIIGTENGIFVTRSIRRNAVPFNLNRLGDLENWPWEFGYAALGNRLVYNKRVTQPMAFGTGAALPPQIDVEAIQVEQYALTHPNEDVEHSAEAGEVPNLPTPGEASSTPMEASEVAADGATGEVSSSAEHAVAHGHKRGDEAADDDPHKRVKFADAAFSMLERTFLEDDSSVAERVPKTPKLNEDAEKQKLNQVTSTDLNLYEHEDQPVSVTLGNEDIECLDNMS